MGHTKTWTTETRNFRTFLLMTQLEPETISRRIAQARKEAGLTQQELADLLSVHKRTVENYEHGRVPWRELARIGSYLDKPIEWFLYGDQAETDEPSQTQEKAELSAAIREFRSEVDRFAETVARLEESLSERAPRPERPERPGSSG